MPKIQLNGFIHDVSNVSFVGSNGQTAKQTVVIRVPGYVDGFGEKIGKDEHWQVTLIGDKIDKFNLHQRHINSKVKTEVFINSTMYQSKKDNSIGYIVNVNLASIEFISKPQSAPDNRIPVETIPDPYYEQRASEVHPGEEDDLPF